MKAHQPDTTTSMNQPDTYPADHGRKASRLPADGRVVELSIVIGTRNRKAILLDCLQALVGKIGVSHQIVVIDAGSTDGTIEHLQGVRGIHLICDGQPIGQAQSFNRVFPLLNSRFIGWISDDNVVQPGMLDTAVEILQRNTKIGMVALKVKDVAGSYTGPPYTAGIYDTGILNCNQGVLRSDLFRQIGYFDEAFKNYGIDPDLTTKVLLAGRRVVHTKAVAIHHFRDHDAEDSAISKTERTQNKAPYKQRYYAKYAYLTDYGRIEKYKMRAKKTVWRHIKKFNKRLQKRGLTIETITGQNMKDWENLTKTRHIKILDPFYNRKKPYYLEQRIPRKVLSSANNPYRALLDWIYFISLKRKMLCVYVV